jgi:N-acetylmuramoyl-L-alanine amidase
MRPINRIILHCTATEPDHDVDVATIRKWHVDGRGWMDIGYHFLVRLDGSIERGRPVMMQGAHVKGHNEDSIGIAYAGGVKDGVPHDTLSNCQYRSMQDLVFSLRMVFGFLPVSGHNEYSTKACPSFQVQDKFPHINTPPTWI